MGKQEKIKTKAQIKEEYNTYYGQRPKAYAGYVDEPSEKNIVTLFESIGKKLSISPSYLFTIACGEGLSQEYLDEITSPYYDANGNLLTEAAISAFIVFGLDFFSSPKEFPRFKKYLPDDYNEGDEYTPHMAPRDERYGKEIVPSAIFKNLESGVEGFGAVLAHRIELFNKQRKKLGYSTPTEDEKAYWHYAYYQAEGDANRALEANKGYSFLTHQAAASPEVHRLCLERVATWRYLLAFNIFTS